MRNPFPMPRTYLLPLLALAVNQSVYYGGNWLARDKVHICMEIPLDRLIPVVPWSIVIYWSCYIVWAAVYLYMARQEKERAYRFFRTDLLSKLVCLAFFVLLPTTNVRPGVASRGLWLGLLALLYRIDAPTNLFPSIHCLVSWLCFIGLRGNGNVPRWVRVGMCCYALAVFWSTLATRQHVLADVLGGVALAELAWLAAGRLRFPLKTTESRIRYENTDYDRLVSAGDQRRGHVGGESHPGAGANGTRGADPHPVRDAPLLL